MLITHFILEDTIYFYLPAYNNDKEVIEVTEIDGDLRIQYVDAKLWN